MDGASRELAAIEGLLSDMARKGDMITRQGNAYAGCMFAYEMATKDLAAVFRAIDRAETAGIQCGDVRFKAWYAKGLTCSVAASLELQSGLVRAWQEWSVTAFRNALRYNPDSRRGWYLLGTLYARMGKVYKGISALREAEQSSDAETRTDAARAIESLERSPDASVVDDTPDPESPLEHRTPAEVMGLGPGSVLNSQAQAAFSEAERLRREAQRSEEMARRLEQMYPEKPKSGCFIATACYGSYDHPDVLVFRQLRDQRLLASRVGRVAVALYYAVSPPVAAWVARVPWVSRMIRQTILEPLAYRLRKRG